MTHKFVVIDQYVLKKKFSKSVGVLNYRCFKFIFNLWWQNLFTEITFLWFLISKKRSTLMSEIPCPVINVQPCHSSTQGEQKMTFLPVGLSDKNSQSTYIISFVSLTGNNVLSVRCGIVYSWWISIFLRSHFLWFLRFENIYTNENWNHNKQRKSPPDWLWFKYCDRSGHGQVRRRKGTMNDK